MLVAESRPRSLSWFHAGSLLFGDWGTSRLYVLGLAFFYTAHASVLYLGVMSVVMISVAWAYTVICRSFPEGGGVYSSARELNKTLSVVGATLLLCNYIVTAGLSAVEAFHYFGIPDAWVPGSAIAAIMLVGLLNWFGARSAGQFALVVALGAMGISLVIAVLCIPFIKDGLKTISWGHPSISDAWPRWLALVNIMLALSGVEAVSNMTGLMKQPVKRTANRTIWPVLIEVVVLNMVFGLALSGLPSITGHPEAPGPIAIEQPDHVTHIVQGSGVVPEHVREYRDTAVRVLAIESGQRALGELPGLILGKVAAVLFGLLLLSAVNTAIMASVSVLYAMARDRELPTALAKLNYNGVPWMGLVLAVLAPVLLITITSDPMHLADLYTIGVVGAITISVLCCAVNRRLPLSGRERYGLWAVGLFMAAVELTVIGTKFHAAFFAAGGLATVMGARFALRFFKPPSADKLEMPAIGWLAEITREPLKQDPGRPRIMLAARGRDQAEFAVELAKKRRATLFGLYVRTLRVMDVTPGQIPRIENDPVAQETLGTVAVLARQANIPFVPIYITATDIASEILDYTVTFGCDTLIMGKSQRTLFSRRVAGDVLAEVAKHLPDEVALITRSASPTAADFTRSIRAILSGEAVEDDDDKPHEAGGPAAAPRPISPGSPPAPPGPKPQA